MNTDWLKFSFKLESTGEGLAVVLLLVVIGGGALAVAIINALIEDRKPEVVAVQSDKAEQATIKPVERVKQYGVRVEQR